jgi:nucleotide-binding universal stress UspA family protein
MTPTVTNTAPFNTIVLATDFQPCSKRAVEVATQLARASAGRLLVVHSFEPPSYAYSGAEFAVYDWFTPLQESARKSLDDQVRALCECGVRAEGVMSVGAAWQNILSVAKEQKADVIVLGTHGRRGVMHALLGSVAEKVVRVSPVPVLTVRGEVDAE